NRSKHYLKCHLIFVCKYRKKLLVGQLKDDMRSILLQITANSNFEIEVFESDLDHIHFLIRYVPRLSITSIVRKLKHESTYHIWHSTHNSFLSKHFWKEHTFRSDGYFVCSIGEASPDTIRAYIFWSRVVAYIPQAKDLRVLRSVFINIIKNIFINSPLTLFNNRSEERRVGKDCRTLR